MLESMELLSMRKAYFGTCFHVDRSEYLIILEAIEW